MSAIYTAPPQDEVYAMDFYGKGHINISFSDSTTGVVGMVLKNTLTSQIIPVTLTKSGNNYSVNLILDKGDYSYYFTDTLVVNVAPPTPYLFSVGYVFVIVGHSLASGNGEGNATNGRVKIYTDYQARVDSDWKNIAKYSGGSYRKAADVYTAAVAANASNTYDYQVGPWAKMAELIAVRDSVNVAIINTAMGGSSMKMWADEAASRPFVHGFGATVAGVEDYNLYNSGIPYFHFENVLKVFGKRTGITAVIVQHGENDNPIDTVKTDELAFFYKTVVEKARTVSGLNRVPVVLAKSAWLTDSSTLIANKLSAIDKALAVTDYSYFGIDTHTIPQTLRGQPTNAGDGHWNIAGSIEVGRLWAERLTAAFLTQINSGISTLPTTVPTVPVPGVVIPGNSQVPVVATTNNVLKSLNWTATAIVVATVGTLMVVLKMFSRVPLFRKLTNITLVVVSVGLGGVYLGINYLVNKKRAL